METDYFGGAGNQAATVFLRGERVLRRTRAASGPVDAALRLVGVVAAGGQDEFDTIGLALPRDGDRGSGRPWTEAPENERYVRPATSELGRPLGSSAAPIAAGGRP